MEDIDIQQAIKDVLTKERYVHTIGVIGEAEKLAKLYGADVDEARTAALLHDCAKCYSDKKIVDMCKEYDIILDKIMLNEPALAHGLLGAKLAENLYGISNSNILNAIAYHTTGRSGMTLLDKIIYVADVIEPNRNRQCAVDTRVLAYENLDDAVISTLNSTINFNKRRGNIIHPFSYDALNDIKAKKNLHSAI